jgi:hypothetical protein
VTRSFAILGPRVGSRERLRLLLVLAARILTRPG